MKTFPASYVSSLDSPHHVIDHMGQFHGNFADYYLAVKWCKAHSEVEIGLKIQSGIYPLPQ